MKAKRRGPRDVRFAAARFVQKYGKEERDRVCKIVLAGRGLPAFPQPGTVLA